MAIEYHLSLQKVYFPDGKSDWFTEGEEFSYIGNTTLLHTDIKKPFKIQVFPQYKVSEAPMVVNFQYKDSSGFFTTYKNLKSFNIDSIKEGHFDPVTNTLNFSPDTLLSAEDKTYLENNSYQLDRVQFTFNVNAEIVEVTTTTNIIYDVEPVPYESVIEYVPTIKNGVQEIHQQGLSGIDKVSYEVTYQGGTEVSRKELSRERTKEPTNEIIYQGTGLEYASKYEDVTDTESVPFETGYIINPDSVSTGKVVRVGTEGQKEVTYTVGYNYLNQELSREKISETITQEPTNEIEEVQTFEEIPDGTEIYEQLPNASYNLLGIKGVDVLTDPTPEKAPETTPTGSESDSQTPEIIPEKVTSLDVFVERLTLINMTATVKEGDTFKSDSSVILSVVNDSIQSISEPIKIILEYRDGREGTEVNSGGGFFGGVTVEYPDDYKLNEDTKTILVSPELTNDKFSQGFKSYILDVNEFMPDTWGTHEGYYIRISVEGVAREGIQTTISKFVDVYNVTPSQLNELANVRFYSPIEAGQVLFDYGEYIFNIYTTYFDVMPNLISNEQKNIQLGMIDSGVKSNYMLDDKLIYNLGSIKVPEKYHNVYDYQNVETKLTVPYVETPISITPEYVIGQEIKMIISLDLYSGNATLNIYSDKIKEGGGLIDRVDVPLTRKMPFGKNGGELIKKELDRYIYDELDTAYIEVVRNIPYQSGSKYGKRTHQFRTLQGITGYVEVENINLSNIKNITETELEMIASQLSNGVIIQEPSQIASESSVQNPSQGDVHEQSSEPQSETGTNNI